MSHTVTLELPDEMLRRYQQGASAARKQLETFIVERLDEAVPPLVSKPPSSIDEELARLEQLDDEALWEIAQSRLSLTKQRRYENLLEKNSQGTITADEAQVLYQLGEEARRLTLKKAHAYMLLKWRGHTIPTPDTLSKLS